jgi:hypothetical protein
MDSGEEFGLWRYTRYAFYIFMPFLQCMVGNLGQRRIS